MSLTGPLTVSIDGHLVPVTLPPREALETLRQAVCALPISGYERQAMRRLLDSSGADLEYRMNGDETTDWPVSLDDGTLAIVRVSYGDRLTCRQRVAARYDPRRAERRGGRPEEWVVWDLERDVAAAQRLGSESAAREWIRRQVQLANYQSGPASEAAR
ncbi:hypothetical protein ACIQOW_38370 [Kitasatospora sp. NPDC091335]|uniref:hypothetical protein n=1 Tax=Kitasatospora sp. NPDC091335 TaxID=3364085 RepID=UPI0038123A8A